MVMIHRWRWCRRQRIAFTPICFSIIIYFVCIFKAFHFLPLELTTLINIFFKKNKKNKPFSCWLVGIPRNWRDFCMDIDLFNVIPIFLNIHINSSSIFIYLFIYYFLRVNEKQNSLSGYSPLIIWMEGMWDGNVALIDSSRGPLYWIVGTEICIFIDIFTFWQRGC
jgi:hypothetical protein